MRGSIDPLKPLKRAQDEQNAPSTVTQKKGCFAKEDGGRSPCLDQEKQSFPVIRDPLKPTKQGWIEVEEDNQNVPNAGTQKRECSKKEDDGHRRSNPSFSAMKGSLMPMKQAWVEDEGDQRNEPSLRARLNKALQEQEQTYVRIVEERRLQVGQIEAQLFLARRNLGEAEAQLTSFRDHNSWTNYHGNAFASLSGSEPVKVEIDLDEGENNQEKERLNDGVAISEPVGVSLRDKQNGSFASENREPPTMTNTHGDKSCIPTPFSDPIAVHEGANLSIVISNGVSERPRTKEKASRAGKGAELGANTVAKFKHSRKGKPMHLLARYQAQRMKFNLCVLPVRFRYIVKKISDRMIKGLMWMNTALDCLHISTEDYLGFTILQEDIHGLMSARWNWFHSASFMNGDLTLPPKTRLTKRVGTKPKHEEFKLREAKK